MAALCLGCLSEVPSSFRPRSVSQLGGRGDVDTPLSAQFVHALDHDAIVARGALRRDQSKIYVAKDKIVALHPHCSRGRYAHYKATFRWWLKIGLSLILFMYFLVAGIVFFGSYPNLVGIVEVCFFGGLALMAILGVIAARVSGKMMGFVRLAEGVFQGFGWTDVKNIDLPAITMKSKQPDDPGALGVLYFRY